MTMNNRNNKTQPSGDTLSWLVVLICLFAAPPLGVILLLVKLSGISKSKGYGSPQQTWQKGSGAYQTKQAPSEAKSGQPYYAVRPPAYQYYNVKKAGKKNEKKKTAEKPSGKGLTTLLMFLGILFLVTGTVFGFGSRSYAAHGSWRL